MYNIGADGQLILSGGNHSMSGTDINGLGSLSLQNGTTLDTQGTVTVDKLNQLGSTIDGLGLLKIRRSYTSTAAVTWTGGGTIQFAQNALVTLSLIPPSGSINRSIINDTTLLFAAPDVSWVFDGSIQFVNNGIVEITGRNFSLMGSATGAFTNSNTGTLTLNTPQVPGQPIPHSVIDFTFSNAGIINVQAGWLEFMRDVNQSAGRTDLLGGILQCDGVFTIGSGSSLNGTGSIRVQELANGGAITVGRAGDPTGSLQIFGLPGVADSGNYTQGGSLTMTLAGTGEGQFGRLIISGKATLAGDLGITLAGGYVPVAGDTLALISWGILDDWGGSFATVPDGWTATYGSAGMTLRKN